MLRVCAVAMVAGSLLSDAQRTMAKEKKATKEKNDRKQELRQERSHKLEDIKKVVNRNIIRMFGKTLPDKAIDVIEVDGLTMRDRMVRDRQELLAAGRVRADPSYFGSLRKQYMSALTGVQMVVAGNAAQELHEGLTETLSAARAPLRRYRKREPLIHWLRNRAQELNQKSVVAVVDLLVETQVSRCPKHSELVREVFISFQRLAMLQKYAKEIAPIFRHCRRRCRQPMRPRRPMLKGTISRSVGTGARTWPSTSSTPTT